MPVTNDPQLGPVVPPAPPGPCDWPVDTTCVADWDTFDPAVRTNAVTLATFVLDALTGRQFSQCPISYRPCGPKCAGGAGYMVWPVGVAPVATSPGPWMIPFVDAGTWRNCVCPGSCSCAARCEVPFPGPVAEVLEVTVDGLVISPDAYRLDSWRGIPRLVRTDGGCWPDCQDMDAAPDAEGSFVISYRPGKVLPLAGQIAAGELAGEFAKACVGGECALPQQLSSLSRNGVEVTVSDPTQLADNGLTGLYNVDLFIRAVNPHNLAQRPRVASPDSRRGRFQ